MNIDGSQRNENIIAKNLDSIFRLIIFFFFLSIVIGLAMVRKDYKATADRYITIVRVLKCREMVAVPGNRNALSRNGNCSSNNSRKYINSAATELSILPNTCLKRTFDCSNEP